jgi:hypothetical protein
MVDAQTQYEEQMPGKPPSHLVTSTPQKNKTAEVPISISPPVSPICEQLDCSNISESDANHAEYQPSNLSLEEAKAEVRDQASCSKCVYGYDNNVYL